MIGNFPENDFERQELVGALEADLGSERQHRETSQVGENFRLKLLNKNTSEMVKLPQKLVEQLNPIVLPQFPGKS